MNEPQVRYVMTTECGSATVTEEWAFFAPEGLDDEGVRDAAFRALGNGDADFVSEKVGNEADRDITSIKRESACEAVTEPECTNCTQHHGATDVCMLAALLGVLEQRLERKLTNEELESINDRYNDDLMWERYIGPAVDVLETSLEAKEPK